MKIVKSVVAIGITLAISLISCTKEAGEGGTSSIIGQVEYRDIISLPHLNIFDTIIDQYPAIERRVYIEYGDDKIYSDIFRTDYDGYYKFENLKKGDYTIFCFAPCDTCPDKVLPVFQEVTISSNNQTVEVPLIYLDNRLN